MTDKKQYWVKYELYEQVHDDNRKLEVELGK
jgi:hypothetical protein